MEYDTEYEEAHKVTWINLYPINIDMCKIQQWTPYSSYQGMIDFSWISHVARPPFKIYMIDNKEFVINVT